MLFFVASLSWFVRFPPIAQALPLPPVDLTTIAATLTLCPVQHRQRVLLESAANMVAPFLWVSWAADHMSGQQALEQNQQGRGDENFVYFHTRTLEQRTVGVVTAACPGNNPHIIGVQILSGSHRGEGGFVDARDVRF